MRNWRPETLSLVTLEAETQSKGILQAIVTLKKDIKRLWIAFWSRTTSTDVEASASIPLPDLTQDNLPQRGEPEMVILRNTTTPAPNITLNRHDKVTRRHLYIAATLGCAVQAGVLIYFGLITYYYPSKFKKEDKAVLGYAFPFSAAGTVLLVTGIFLCAHVVDRSTSEIRYEPTQGYEVRLVWLQPKQTVSDQVFKSFALYPEECPQIITTSQRHGPKDKAKGKGESTPRREEGSAINLSVFGTGISLAGFFVQFIGLRAMHWSASVAQLTAILIMTAVRAFIRRGFTAAIHGVPLKEGFELDGLAMVLGHTDPILDSGPADKKPIFDFGLSKGGSWTVMMNGVDTPDDSLYDGVQQSNTDTLGTGARRTRVRSPPTESIMICKDNTAQNILSLRTRLAQLADWRGPASTEASQLAEAIESTMDLLYPTERPNLFSWAINVKVSDDKDLDKYFTVVLQLKRNEGHWKCRVDELDSILSLWLCSIDKQRRSSTAKLGGSLPKSASPMDNDAWFRKKSSETRGGLVLIGQQTDELSRFLKWWMPTDWSAKFSIENNESLANWDLWRVVGSKGTDYPDSANASATSPLENSSCDDSEESDDLSNHLSYESCYGSLSRSSSGSSSRSSSKHSSSSGSSKRSSTEDRALTFLAIQSHESLERLYAQHIFFAFLWAAIKNMHGTVRYHPELDLSSPLDTRDWTSLRLQCTDLSKLAGAIQTSGLMDLHSAFHTLIPPLYLHTRFGELNCVIEMITQKAKKKEQLLNWAAGAEYYEQLFLLSGYFRVTSYIYTKSVALIVEYIRTINDLLQDVLPKEKERKQFSEAETAAKNLSSLLEQKACPQTLNSLRNLYSLQSEGRRAWSKNTAFLNTRQQSLVKNEEIKYCNLTNLHRWIVSYVSNSKAKNLRTRRERRKRAPICLPSSLHQYVNTPDILGWTPLHYAVSGSIEGGTGCVRALVRAGADVNVTDIREYTPLHHFLMHHSDGSMKTLLERGANVKAVGVDGMTPLHVAASSRRHIDLRDLLFNPRQPADQFAADNLGRAPIHLAVLTRTEPAIDQLRLSIGARDKEGRTALHLAAFSGHWQAVAKLVGYGASLDEPVGAGDTMLHWAVKEENFEAVDELLRLGATVDLKGRHHWTTLHEACSQKHDGIARLLIQNGADVNATDWTNETPIMVAIRKGSSKVVDLLLRSPNVELEHRNRLYPYSDCTALGMAVKEGNIDIVKMLVEKGAIIDSQTLGVAEENKENLSIAQLIREFYELENCVRKHIQGEGADVV